MNRDELKEQIEEICGYVPADQDDLIDLAEAYRAAGMRELAEEVKRIEYEKDDGGYPPIVKQLSDYPTGEDIDADLARLLDGTPGAAVPRRDKGDDL